MRLVWLLVILSVGVASESPFKFIFKNGRYFGKQTKSVPITSYATNSHVTTDYFSQKLDHFLPSNTKTWNQFYWVNDQFYKPGGPAFIQIGGEGPTSRHWIDTNEGIPDWLKNARRFGAMCFQLEHRYYGQSKPTADLSTSNLKWLSSRQALADIASFIDGMREKYPQLKSANWVVFGGSYSGALSAWFRLKYPQYAAGSIATSAPVLAQVDFKEYLEVVGDSLATYSQACKDNVAAATIKIEQLIESNNPADLQTLQNKFKLCDPIDVNNKLDIQNLYSFLAGNFMGVVQYTEDNRGIYADTFTINNVCGIMTNATLGDAFDRYAKVNDFILTNSDVECVDFKYDKMIAALKNNNDWLGSARQWIYQTCTEFGYYQTTTSDRQPFGKADDFPLEFSLQQCRDIFDDSLTNDVIANAIDQTNAFYGGRDLKADKVVLPNGSLDPWHALGILTDVGPFTRALYINGTAHCANMYPPRSKDKPGLTAARLEITEWISYFLGETKEIPFRNG